MTIEKMDPSGEVYEEVVIWAGFLEESKNKLKVFSFL